MNKTDPLTTEKSLNLILSFLENQDNFVFLDTNRIDSSNSRSYVFSGMKDRLLLKKGDNKEEFFRQAENYLEKGFYLSGWMAYELGYLLEPALYSLQEINGEQILADFGVFPAPTIFEHQSGQFNSDIFSQNGNKANIDAKVEDPSRQTIENLRLNQEHEDYLKNVRRIKAYIEAGDTYQVNYTLKLLFDFKGDPLALFKNLRNNQNVSYGAYLKLGDQIIQSFSPELFFRKTGNNCTVRPMKGTSARGKTLSDDEIQASRLQKDIKNRSENVMIVDLLRNDLGRICQMGQVEVTSLFDIETYQTLHQMTSAIQGNLLPNIGLMDLFKAIFPCGSVTGAPKIRTMEIIKELELAPRGVYTGAIGFISPQRDMVFNVPIRTIVLNKNRGEMGIGSGIVHDSDPEDEWQECLLKGRFLTNQIPEFQIIETILWAPEKGFFLLDPHIHRLTQSAAYFDFPINGQLILEELDRQASFWRTPQDIIAPDNAKKEGQTAQRVRVLLHRDGQFSVTATSCEIPKDTSLPFQPRTYGNPKVTIAKTLTDSASLHLFHKTTRRKDYDRELHHARANGFTEVFFRNEKGEMTEGSISNIVIQTGEHYLTPPVSSGLLPGTFRAHLLKTYPQYIQEKALTQKDMEEADHIYMVNSVRGLIKVELER